MSINREAITATFVRSSLTAAAPRQQERQEPRDCERYEAWLKEHSAASFRRAMLAEESHTMTPSDREAIIAELAAMESQEQPIRRFSITIKAGGDTREALVGELRNIVSSIANGGTGGYMGGPTAGSLHDLVERPGVTGESYLAALKEWLKGQERIDELNQQLADLDSGALRERAVPAGYFRANEQFVAGMNQGAMPADDDCGCISCDVEQRLRRSEAAP